MSKTTIQQILLEAYAMTDGDSSVTHFKLAWGCGGVIVSTTAFPAVDRGSIPGGFPEHGTTRLPENCSKRERVGKNIQLRLVRR